MRENEDSRPPGTRTARIILRTQQLSLREVARVNRALRNEFTSGILVITAAILGFTLANTPAASLYTRLRDWHLGPDTLGLNLSLHTWASDGLLAIFFFIVGLELKREFTTGALRRASTAIIPIAAAFGGVALPALIYLAFTAGTTAAHGWAVPTATDIAFAVAILGLIAPRIHPMLRVFLLTLAVVDDFIAIAIIAIFYAGTLHLGWLALALIPLAGYAILTRVFAYWFARHPWAAWLILLPLGLAVWLCIHHSGIHATIAGVLLAFTVPATTIRRRGQRPDTDVRTDTDTADTPTDLAGIFAHRFGPLSAGIAVPIFAFFASGVSLTGTDSRFPFDPIAYGILIGFIIGKPVGITLTTLALTRLTRSRLADGIPTRELIGVACLGGIGFTVALLIAELSYTNPADTDTARLAVMTASLAATLTASCFLVRPQRRAERTAH